MGAFFNPSNRLRLGLSVDEAKIRDGSGPNLLELIRSTHAPQDPGFRCKDSRSRVQRVKDPSIAGAMGKLYIDWTKLELFLTDHQPSLPSEASGGATSDQDHVEAIRSKVEPPDVEKPRRLGRPPAPRVEIEAAYIALRDANQIDFDAPKNRLYKPIRAKVREQIGNPDASKGLQKEAIRSVIGSLFDADKAKRNTSP